MSVRNTDSIVGLLARFAKSQVCLLAALEVGDELARFSYISEIAHNENASDEVWAECTKRIKQFHNEFLREDLLKSRKKARKLRLEYLKSKTAEDLSRHAKYLEDIRLEPYAVIGCENFFGDGWWSDKTFKICDEYVAPVLDPVGVDAWLLLFNLLPSWERSLAELLTTVVSLTEMPVLRV